MEPTNLPTDRDPIYGETHYLAGLVIGVLREPFINLIMTHPELVHNWVLMLSKLIRALFSPTKVDHYDDIIGYALLTKRILEKGDNDGPEFVQTK